MPPVLCLSILGGVPAGQVKVSPLSSMARVRAEVSAASMPRKTTAMAKALIW